MSERHFSVKGNDFALNKIDVFKQFAIARRLGPILGDIFKVAPKLKTIKEDASEEQKLESIAELAKPVMDGLSKLSDEDANLVLLGLCSGVEIKQTHNWARISDGKVLMFDSLDLPTLLQIAGRSFVYNIGSFFTIAPQTSHGGK